jgi:sugar lactone lactonase YvrE
VDEKGTVIVADSENHRIVEWNQGATSGTVLAGGNGNGDRPDQLNDPTDVIFDRAADSLIICEQGNRRVTQWSRRSGIRRGETIVNSIDCCGLAVDEEGFVYVTDEEKHEVRRYRRGKSSGILVAGGTGKGAGLHELSGPSFVCVNREHAVFVSDKENHRVMKWKKDAKEGIIVAGGLGEGKDLKQLSHPNGLLVDATGSVYVADSWNHRVMRWCRGATRGVVLVGGNGEGEGANQLNYPTGLFFDRHGHLYVADLGNNRVQRFSLETN